MSDATDNVYRYIVCAICPVVDGKQEATVGVEPEHSYMIESSMIDGRKYIHSAITR